MAIMHVRMLGTINDEPKIDRDESGNIIYATFSILVTEETQRVPFTVYSSDEQLIESVEQDLLLGNVVLVSGIINIVFQNNDQGSFPVISSNMIINANDIRVVYGKKELEFAAMDKQIIPFVAHDQSETFLEFDPDIELPF